MVPLLLAMAAVQAAPDSSAAASPVGTWANPNGSVVVEIAACGDSELCGRVSWASEKAQADARKHGTDPLIGTELMHNFVPRGTDRWKGMLFVPDLKRTSKADLQQLAPDRIKIRGCAVGRALCKSQIWTRTQAAAGAAE